MNTSDKWRKEINNLTDKELIDELDRPTGDWKEDIFRETIKRILKHMKR